MRERSAPPFTAVVLAVLGAAHTYFLLDASRFDDHTSPPGYDKGLQRFSYSSAAPKTHSAFHATTLTLISAFCPPTSSYTVTTDSMFK